MPFNLNVPDNLWFDACSNLATYKTHQSSRYIRMNTPIVIRVFECDISIYVYVADIPLAYKRVNPSAMESQSRDHVRFLFRM